MLKRLTLYLWFMRLLKGYKLKEPSLSLEAKNIRAFTTHKVCSTSLNNIKELTLLPTDNEGYNVNSIPTIYKYINSPS